MYAEACDTLAGIWQAIEIYICGQIFCTNDEKNRAVGSTVTVACTKQPANKGGTRWRWAITEQMEMSDYDDIRYLFISDNG